MMLGHADLLKASMRSAATNEWEQVLHETDVSCTDWQKEVTTCCCTFLQSHNVRKPLTCINHVNDMKAQTCHCLALMYNLCYYAETAGTYESCKSNVSFHQRQLALGRNDYFKPGNAVYF